MSGDLRDVLEAPSYPTVGLEEEVMVLDAGTLDLVPRGADVLAASEGPPRFKPELVASQVEIVTPPAATVGEAAALLAAGRRDLAAAAGTAGLRLACAGAHPSAAPEGDVTPGARYEALAAQFGIIARRQLVSSVQVHVAIRGADRALAVHNALRSYLPEIAALFANAPFHAGRDTGLASIRPIICTHLPRQGVPPAIASWEAHAAALELIGDPGSWWWELRPHHVHGTLEFRVPDAQATVHEAGAVAAVAQSLAVWLARRHDSGEALAVAETWRIEQNRWSALRYGLAGTMIDLESGTPEPTSERAGRLLATLAPIAADLGCGIELEHARTMLAAGGPAAVLRDRAGGDPHAATRILADRFLEAL